MTLIVACGLKREARIVDGPGRDVFSVIGGGDAARLDRDLDDMAEMFPGIILSCGIAGALMPDLQPGDVVIDGEAPALEHLQRALPHAHRGAIVGNDAIVATAAEKYALHERTGALAVDMESHVAARVAQAHGLPFAIVRIVSDEVDHLLPHAITVSMRADGGFDRTRMRASLAAAPEQMRDVVQTMAQFAAGFRGLRAGAQKMGERLAFPG